LDSFFFFFFFFFYLILYYKACVSGVYSHFLYKTTMSSGIAQACTHCLLPPTWNKGSKTIPKKPVMF
jgi:hypothetical protein